MDVATYIQSGNAVLSSSLQAETLAAKVEQKLQETFKLDTTVKVLALTASQLKHIVEHRPKGFGDEPDKYHCDTIFLMGIDRDEALAAFSPHEGVDTIWPGKGVIYSQRLSARRTKSRLNRVMASPLYRSMTIRNWATTLKLLEVVGAKPERKAP